MGSSSRMDRLVTLLGGEQNLPPKLTKPTTEAAPSEAKTEKETSTGADQASKLQSLDSFQEEGHNSDNWWDATPRIPQAPQQQPAKPAVPYSSDGSLHFEFDSSKGNPAPRGISFSPFLAVTKFCYKFVKKELQQPLATAFFDEGKIWNRGWDLYFVWSDYCPTAKPVTFIPEYQLLALIEEINQHFPNANIKITDDLRDEGLVIDFDDIESADLRPRFLGHSTSRDQIEYWTTHLPLPATIEGTMDANDRELAAFRAKMELVAEVSKNKSKAKKQQRQAETVVKRQDMVRMLTRAQRYLGLAAQSGDASLPDISNLSLSAIDVTDIVPHAFDSDVIFIAIDLEAYEMAQSQITEVGIATLDTRDLQNDSPGNVGEDWQKFIRARHFRIAEYYKLVNKKFVEGCPDKFEFGKSEVVGKDKIAKEVAACFKSPYSGPGLPSIADQDRNIVLVGHDISQDVNLLKQIGFSIANNRNIIDTVDTVSLFRTYNKDPSARSLGSLLYEFDLMGWHLHNAGNDAVYTLWAMLGICVKAASERGSAEAAKKMEEKLEQRAEVAVEQAKERAKDEAEGWESRDDRGVPVPLSETGGSSRGRPRQLFTSGGAILDV